MVVNSLTSHRTGSSGQVASPFEWELLGRDRPSGDQPQLYRGSCVALISSGLCLVSFSLVAVPVFCLAGSYAHVFMFFLLGNKSSLKSY